MMALSFLVASVANFFTFTGGPHILDHHEIDLQ
jgi:hypothetical protein